MKRLDLILFVLLCAIWSPGYLFIKVAVGAVSPLTVAFVRVGVGAMALSTICLIQKRNLWEWRHLWPKFLTVGSLLCTIPFLLISWGEMTISSSLAAIILGTLPLFTALIAHFIFPDERLSLSKAVGVAVALSGIALIYLPDLLGGHGSSGLGILALFAASFSFAAGTVYSRIAFKGLPFLIAPTGHLIGAFLTLLPFFPWISIPAELPIPAAASLIVLGLCSTALLSILYQHSITALGAARASLVMFIAPIISLALGIIFLGERLSTYSILGGLFIFAGLTLSYLKTKSPSPING